jgi:hypothetical protein
LIDAGREKKMFKWIARKAKAVKHYVVGLAVAGMTALSLMVSSPVKADIIADLVLAADIAGLSTAVSTILVGMVAFTVAFLAFALITRGLKAGKRS